MKPRPSIQASASWLRKSLQYTAIRFITQLPTCSKFVKGMRYFVDGEVTGFTVLPRGRAMQSPSGPPGAQLKARVFYQGGKEEEVPGNNKKSLNLPFFPSHLGLSLGLHIRKFLFKRWKKNQWKTPTGSLCHWTSLANHKWTPSSLGRLFLKIVSCPLTLKKIVCFFNRESLETKWFCLNNPCHCPLNICQSDYIPFNVFLWQNSVHELYGLGHAIATLWTLVSLYRMWLFFNVQGQHVKLENYRILNVEKISKVLKFHLFPNA